MTKTLPARRQHPADLHVFIRPQDISLSPKVDREQALSLHQLFASNYVSREAWVTIESASFVVPHYGVVPTVHLVVHHLRDWLDEHEAVVRVFGLFGIDIDCCFEYEGEWWSTYQTEARPFLKYARGRKGLENATDYTTGRPFYTDGINLWYLSDIR